MAGRHISEIKTVVWASIVGAVLSGLPSLLLSLIFDSRLDVKHFVTQGYVPTSLIAAGNILLPASGYSRTQMCFAGLLMHVLLSAGASFLMCNCTRGISSLKQLLLRCVLIAGGLHVSNLLIVPHLWHMPLMENLLKQTGHLPHFLDHMSLGLTNAVVIHLLRFSEHKEV